MAKPIIQVFSFGYDGWGSATSELVKATAAVEESRGYDRPVFVDVRARRGGRAIGFREHTFERLLGYAHYRWMLGLGNRAVLTGRGKGGLVRPEDTHELLGLVLACHERQQRVIFYCSCPMPADWCHRHLVAKGLRETARRQNVRVSVSEWPGGEPAQRNFPELHIKPELLRDLRRGRSRIPLTRGLPNIEWLSLPWGSVVKLMSKDDQQFVTLGPAAYSHNRWSLPVFLFPVEPEDTSGSLSKDAKKFRRQWRCSPL